MLQLTVQLSNEWRLTKTAWRDQKALEFEARYLDNLFSDANAAASVQEKLEALINKVKQDCE
jgi:hypothetical protein